MQFSIWGKSPRFCDFYLFRRILMDLAGVMAKLIGVAGQGVVFV
jgi:hypothetical protein